jgi:transaldolase
LIGGDIVLTIPYGWQKKFNASDIRVFERMDFPVEPGIIEELYNRFADFRRAYDPDGLSIAEFDTFGPTLRTLRSFIASYRDLQATIREFMLPDPDARRQG